MSHIRRTHNFDPESAGWWWIASPHWWSSYETTPLFQHPLIGLKIRLICKYIWYIILKPGHLPAMWACLMLSWQYRLQCPSRTWKLWNRHGLRLSLVNCVACRTIPQCVFLQSVLQDAWPWFVIDPDWFWFVNDPDWSWFVKDPDWFWFVIDPDLRLTQTQSSYFYQTCVFVVRLWWVVIL